MHGIFVDEDSIMVIPGLVHLQGGRVSSHCDAVPLQDFIKDLPKPSKPRAITPKSEPTGQLAPELLKAYP